MPSMSLKGKRALVTGSSQGIGAAIATLFAREGANVAVNHRGGMPHRDEMVESINRGGGKAFAVHGDVGDPASVKKMFAEAEKRMGGLDILVNAAGLADPKLWNLELSKTTLEMWQRVFAVDAFGTFLCSQAAAGIMKRGSSIVNIASTPALAGDREGLVYASAKGAVASMTRMMAKMLAPKIRVNCMVFGSIETSWVQWLDGSQKKEYLKAIPLGRFGKPEEAADLALFFASDQSSFITGQALVLDGGEVLR